jgi:hypothetical protein
MVFYMNLFISQFIYCTYFFKFRIQYLFGYYIMWLFDIIFQKIIIEEKSLNHRHYFLFIYRININNHIFTYYSIWGFIIVLNFSPQLPSHIRIYIMRNVADSHFQKKVLYILIGRQFKADCYFR